MKAFQFLLGLAILAFVMWTAIAPVNADAKSLVGGWVWVGNCTVCGGNVNVTCNVAAPYPAVCSSSNEVNVCNTDGTGGHCQGENAYPCSGYSACNNAEDTTCG